MRSIKAHKVSHIHFESAFFLETAPKSKICEYKREKRIMANSRGI